MTFKDINIERIKNDKYIFMAISTLAVSYNSEKTITIENLNIQDWNLTRGSDGSSFQIMTDLDPLRN
jgi:hypothetical protein